MNEGTWFRPSVSHGVRSRRAAFVLVACGVLAGCSTQLRTVRVKDADTIPTAGVPYNLTYTQYEITVARRLAGCANDTTKAKELLPHRWLPMG